MLHHGWGRSEMLTDQLTGGCVVLVTIFPEAALPEQRHLRRAERWLAMESGLWVKIGDAPEKRLRWGSEVVVPAGVWHWVANPTKSPRRVMQTILGEYSEADTQVR